jgi:peptidoglycan/xylan/chitin deacetylase (PgdA/CDA1 family)
MQLELPTERKGTLAPEQQAEPETFRFVMESRDPFVLYGAHLLADFCGLTLVEQTSGSDVTDLYYGNDLQEPCRIRVPVSSPYLLSTIPRIPSENDFIAARNLDAPFSFDLFKALHFWLADMANEGTSHFDAHGRLIASRSAQQALDLREIPIVNHYLLLMRWWLQVRCNLATRSFIPAGKKCVLVLSHDVDNPIDPSNVCHRLWFAVKAARAHKGRDAINCLRDGVHAFVRKLGGCADRYDLFDDILRLEDSYGFRSSFFFSPVTYLEGHRLDVVYDVSTPRFRSIMRDLVAENWEVGLHISYNAHQVDGQIARERARLEQLAGSRVRGSRHHYWHMGNPFWNTLEQHDVAGLEYDSSLAFNDAPGYRLGIAYPFRPWNPLSQRAVATLQIPTVLMDGSYFYNPGQTADDALVRIKTLLEHLKESEGVAAIDWHAHTASPGSAAFREWGKAYLLLLAYLAADQSIVVCSFSQLLELMDHSTCNRYRQALHREN